MKDVQILGSSIKESEGLFFGTIFIKCCILFNSHPIYNLYSYRDLQPQNRNFRYLELIRFFSSNLLPFDKSSCPLKQSVVI